MTPLLLAEGSNAALITFAIYTLAVFGIAALSNQLLKSKSFLSEYFLGSRSLGVWAFALTFAATSSSGGSFAAAPAVPSNSCSNFPRRCYFESLAFLYVFPSICLGSNSPSRYDHRG